MIQTGAMFGGRDCDDRAGEHPAGPGRRRLLLGLHAVAVEFLAAQPLQCRVEVGGHAHVYRADGPDGRGIGPQRPAVGEQRHPGHRLHPAGDRQRQLAGPQPRSGLPYGVDPRGAEPVDGDTGNPVTPAGQQRRGAGDIGALLIDLGRAADNHVVDGAGVQPGPLHQRVLEQHQKIGRGAVMQRALRRGLGARRADIVEDQGKLVVGLEGVMQMHQKRRLEVMQQEQQQQQQK